MSDATEPKDTSPKEYAIFWKNKLTGYEGHSDPMLSKAEAEEIADYLNRDAAWSHLVHWAAKVEVVEA